MKLVVLKTLNRLQQLGLLADGPPVQDSSSLFDLYTQAYKIDLVPGKLLNATRIEGSHKAIPAAECMEQLR